MLKFIKQFGLWLSLLVYGVPQVAPVLLDESVAISATTSGPAIASLPAIAGATAIVAALAEDVQATTIHGLNWDKSNCDASSDIRLIWSGSNLLSRSEQTAIWRYNPKQQTGYYAVAWSSPNSGSWDGGTYSYGTHPWPGSDCQVNGSGQGINGTGSGGTVHCWEQAGVGSAVDNLATAGVNPGYTVTKSQWYTQCRRVHLATSGACNGQYRHDYFPDLDNNPTRVITTCLASISGAGATPAFYFGGSDWEAGACGAGTNDETLSGKLRGIQLYNVALSDADVATEAANQYSNAATTTAGIANLWYINQDPIPSDITDKSGGTAHTPTWANASRPTQFDSTFGSAAQGHRRSLQNVGP